MRVFAWCLIGTTLTLAGCYVNEYASEPKVKAKVTAPECTDEDCCSTVTRAGMLKKSTEQKNAAEESQTK